MTSTRIVGNTMEKIDMHSFCSV